MILRMAEGPGHRPKRWNLARRACAPVPSPPDGDRGFPSATGRIVVVHHCPASRSTRQAAPAPSSPWHRRPGRARRAPRRIAEHLGARCRGAGGLRKDDPARPVGRAPEPRVAWLSADHRDNDPAVLLTYLTAALDRIEPLAPGVFGHTASRGAGVTDVIRLAGSIAAMREPVALVLDNAEAITNPECRDIVAGLALRLPAGSVFGIGSRQQVPVPLPRLRVEGLTLEVGAEDLAMGAAEAQLLLDGAGIAVAEPDVHRSRRAHRRLAGRPVPRGVGDERRQLTGRHRAADHRWRPLHRGVPAIGVPRSRLTRRRVVSRPDLHPRSPQRPALRRHRRRKPIRAHPRPPRAPQPARDPPRSPRRVVSLSPSVP